MTLGAEAFDRNTEREGRLSKRGKAERERKKSDFWGYNQNKALLRRRKLWWNDDGGDDDGDFSS